MADRYTLFSVTIRTSKHRDHSVWTISSQAAASFMRRVLPFLRAKKEEVELALTLQASIDEWNHKLGWHYGTHPKRDEIFAERAAIAEKIKAIKHRGFTRTDTPCKKH